MIEKEVLMKRRGLSDTELIEMLSGSESTTNQAVSFILKEYGDQIKGHMLKQTQNIEDAEDSLYEGVAALVLNVRKGTFKGESSIRVYLTSICRRIWFKKFKRMMLFKEYALEKEAELEDYYEDHFLNSETKEIVEYFVSTLKEKCRKVLRLWSYSYSMKEIAEKLEYSTPQVAMNKKNLCLKELRDKIHGETELMKKIVG